MQQIHVPLNFRGPASQFLALLALSGCTENPSQSEPVQPAAVETANATSTEASAQNVFVGIATCAECHAEQHESYLNTAHSRSLSVVDPDAEPPDNLFLHDRSGRTYQVYRHNGQLRHREALLSENGESIAESDYPVTYLVGSGRHSRTYVSEIDGFLVESPITWYESRREWDVSPGYDVPFPPGFERAADMGCVACHVGNAEAIDGSLHRIRFHELAIGCERCHGPGGDHVDAARSDHSNDEIIASITNPGRLSRMLVEDICAQCHLRGDATAFLPDTGPMDFRPGSPLTSVRVDFVVDLPNRPMKVVGHVEQMRLSRCYTQSRELTCTTCHEMHAEASSRVAMEFYRSRCLDCHAANDCGLPETDEQRATSHDNCIYCHMPQSETDIPHIAFTHHRIGVHTARVISEQPRSVAPRLVPHQDVSALDEFVIQRLTGLAYLEIAAKQPSEQAFAHCYDEAIRLLADIDQQGLSDGEVEAALAQLSLHVGPRRAAWFAEAALERDSLTAQSRVNALLVQALTARELGNRDQAVRAFEELQTLRRFAEDCVLLGDILAASDPDRAAASLNSAAAIQPFRADIATALALQLENLGRSRDAALHRQRAELLRQLNESTNNAR